MKADPLALDPRTGGVGEGGGRRGVNPSKGGGGRVGNGPERHQKNQAETLDGKKPAEILDRAAAADASGQPMTSDKEAEEPMTDKLHQPMTDKEEQAKTDKLHQPMTSDKEEQPKTSDKEEKPKQGRGLKRSRSVESALDESAG